MGRRSPLRGRPDGANSRPSNQRTRDQHRPPKTTGLDKNPLDKNFPIRAYSLQSGKFSARPCIEMLIPVLALLAGFFAGVTLTLLGAFLRAEREFGKAERERMLWTNKALVREGHAPIFSAEMIDGESQQAIGQHLPQARRIASPFTAGIRRKAEEIAAGRKNPDVPNIPESIQQRIREAAPKRPELVSTKAA